MDRRTADPTNSLDAALSQQDCGCNHKVGGDALPQIAQNPRVVSRHRQSSARSVYPLIVGKGLSSPQIDASHFGQPAVGVWQFCIPHSPYSALGAPLRCCSRPRKSPKWPPSGNTRIPTGFRSKSHLARLVRSVRRGRTQAVPRLQSARTPKALASIAANTP